MIALDLQQETPTTATSSLLGLQEEGGEGTLSFSALLKGIKEDANSVQNGALVLALNEKNVPMQGQETLKTSKAEALLTFFNIDETDQTTDMLDINPEISKILSPKELKALIQDAKTYLKNQIIQTDAFGRQQMQELPKTLKGLAELAQKLDIDVAKITLENVDTKYNAKLPLQEGMPKQDVKQKTSLTTPLADIEKISKEEKQGKIFYENHITDKEVKKQLQTQEKNLPLFTLQKKAEISTEQIVSAKAIQSDTKTLTTQKRRSDETLKLLLQGENAAKKEGSILTSDFSVTTAKVIAPSAERQKHHSLESLLNSTESDTQENTTKTEAFQAAKTESFEVKLNEAKQMMKYLSQDVKQAIDNYKAPFTRVKVQLNPQNLGDIELTVVQRGKNLHVNLSSNNTAINTLAMNANDLKVHLQNSGINNASLNFSNNGQESAFSNSGQAQQQQRENAQHEYNYFENEEANEEILSSLEIVVPNYA